MSGKTHVVLKKIKSASDVKSLQSELGRRLQRVRRMGFLNKIEALGLSWIYTSTQAPGGAAASDAFIELTTGEKVKIIERLKESGLEDGGVGAFAKSVDDMLRAIMIEYTDVDHSAKKMLGRRAQRLADGASPPFDMRVPPFEVELLTRASGPLPLVGPSDVDEVDELWAEIHARAPWMPEASTAMWRGMRGAVDDGRGPLLPPVLLHGLPGIGKTSLPRLLAELTGAPAIEIDAGLSAAGFRIGGSDRTWASSQPGEPVRTILRHRVANPVIVVNEIDRVGGGMVRARGSSSSLSDALLTMLDRESAARFRCPYHGLPFDMSAVTWVLTANVLDTVDPVLLTRVRRFEIKRPDAEHVSTIVRRRLSGLDRDLADDAAEMVADRWRAEPRMTLRQVAALVERIGAAASGPRLH